MIQSRLYRNIKSTVAKPHGLAYSFVGYQTLYLAVKFPSIYWNCACLIVNSGAVDLLNADLSEEVENTTVNYGKISTALGKIKHANIKILPPNINTSDLTFKPDNKNNAILYGMKGIDSVGNALIYDIINNRPYNSIDNFLNKIKVNKTQMYSLIKAGLFDEFYKDRKEAIDYYTSLIAEKKDKLTLSNLNMLIQRELIPQEFDFEIRLYNFNKYIKKNKIEENKQIYYKLDNIAMNFYIQYFDTDLLIDAIIDNEYSSAKISDKQWNKIYQKQILPIKDWILNNQEEILKQLNYSLYQEIENKYASGDINKWDMESLGTYCHKHELDRIDNLKYGIIDFDYLKEEPEISSEFVTKDNALIRLYSINRICGTVVDKDKNRNTISLLTPSMRVVSIKIWKNQYAKWDRQISRHNPDGTKTIVEKSWFERGNKLIVSGIRRGDDFVPKVYKSTPYPLFERIDELSEDGIILKSATERSEEE